MIHRDIKENEKENNWDTLDKVVEEFPYDTTSDEMEEFVTDEDVD